MNVLLLCGYYEAQFESMLAGCSKSAMEHAANLFQKKLITGLRSQPCSLRVVSAPFIGSWPNRSAIRYFRGFPVPSREGIAYVPFHNLWGWRSFSRARALEKPIEDFIQETHGTRRAIVVYAPHTPFLEAAVRAKRKAPDLRICLIVPDLPQYMNLSEKPHRFYDFCKRIDIWYLLRLNRQVDCYWLLTKTMTELFPTGSKPALILEGIAAPTEMVVPARRSKTFVYAGKLLRRFGVQRLLDAFALLEDPDCGLVICGAGEMQSTVQEAAEKDARIHHAGVLTPSELHRLYRTSGVLVNPRTSVEAYTRYSFPSKILEYLQTGLPVVSARLDGMPAIYDRLLFQPENDTAEALCQAMTAAMNANPSEEAKRLNAVQNHLRSLAPSAVASRLLALLFPCEEKHP